MSTAGEAVSRPGFVRRVYDWVMRNAHGPRAWAAMAAFAFAEASFFPLPPDMLLIPMLLADRRRAFLIGAWCTMWSVLGGALGYTIGYMFWDTAGLWLINVLNLSLATVEGMRATYQEHSYLIAVQGLTPIPYKLVTISAGLAGVSFPLFMLFSVAARGTRFMGEAALFYFFGDRARGLLEKYLGPLLIAMLILIVVGIVAVPHLFKH
ncbi:MAG TPA: hypothetical protein VHL34_19800 [Rhizomicrobium sp.]|nr:hypothetical protein [Rhizomicrobium sp.]